MWKKKVNYRYEDNIIYIDKKRLMIDLIKDINNSNISEVNKKFINMFLFEKSKDENKI